MGQGQIVARLGDLWPYGTLDVAATMPPQHSRRLGYLMIGGLALLVIVAVVIFGVAMARHRMPAQHADRTLTSSRYERGTRGPAMAGSAAPLDTSVPAVLNRAVERGQLSADTMGAILDAEAALAVAEATTQHAGRPRRVASATVEAIGYLGSVLALVGMGFLVGRSWSDIGQGGRIGMLAGLTALLLAVGLLLRQEGEVVLWRLRNFVLLLSTGALAGCTAVVVVDTFDWRNQPVAISVGLVVAAYSAVLWARRDRPAQQATALAGSLVAIGTSMGWWIGAGAAGVTVLVLSAAWLAAAARDLVPPQETAGLLGLVGVLVGPAITSGSFDRWAPVLGLAVAIALLVYGARTHRFAFTGFGVIGLLAYLTFAVTRWFGGSLKAPGVLVVAGIALLVATIVLVRRGQRHSASQHGPTSHTPRAAH